MQIICLRYLLDFIMKCVANMRHKSNRHRLMPRVLYTSSSVLNYYGWTMYFWSIQLWLGTWLLSLDCCCIFTSSSSCYCVFLDQPFCSMMLFRWFAFRNFWYWSVSRRNLYSFVVKLLQWFWKININKIWKIHMICGWFGGINGAQV